MFIDNRIGGATRCHLRKPDDFHMFVHPYFVRCVVFVVNFPTPGKTEVFGHSGTGFLVSVPLGPRHVSHYVVTAKHVSDKVVVGTKGIRLKRVDGVIENLEISEQAKWWYHPDEPGRVDAAVMSIGSIEGSNRSPLVGN